MLFEVIDIYTNEVERQFNNENDAWGWIRSQGDHADRYDIIYDQEALDSLGRLEDAYAELRGQNDEY